MLTHFVNFHTLGASETSVSDAEYGWSQGHFLGGYLGHGAGGAELDDFQSGWAQGHFLSGYLGSGAGGAELDDFESGWAQGSWLAYYYGAGAGAGGDQDRSPWWNYWRNKTGWYDTNTPSLAELVLSGQQTFIEAPTGEDVPLYLPDEQEAEELLLEIYGDDGLAGIADGIGISEKEAESVVRWMGRTELAAIVDWRASLIDQNNLIILLAMIDE